MGHMRSSAGHEVLKKPVHLNGHAELQTSESWTGSVSLLSLCHGETGHLMVDTLKVLSPWNAPSEAASDALDSELLLFCYTWWEILSTSPGLVLEGKNYECDTRHCSLRCLTGVSDPLYSKARRLWWNNVFMVKTALGSVVGGLLLLQVLLNLLLGPDWAFQCVRVER